MSECIAPSTTTEICAAAKAELLYCAAAEIRRSAAAVNLIGLPRALREQLERVLDDAKAIEHLCAEMREQNKEPVEVVGISEIADMANVRKGAVVMWRKRDLGFPQPVFELRQGPVFSRGEVEIWLRKTRRPR